MARKSLSLRLSESEKLVASYLEAGMEEDYRYRFITDVVARLRRGKSLTSKQRNWLDSLIEEGVPAPKGDPKLISRIETACRVDGMREYDVKILGDFLSKIKRGWDLSAKQAKWMDGLLAESERIAIEGPYVPDTKTVDRLKKCVKLSGGYSSMYWQTHGGTAKALGNVKAWLENGGNIDEWSVNKLTKALGAKLRELESIPYVSQGDLVWCRLPRNGGNTSLGVVSTSASVSDRGQIVYGVLVDGEVFDLTKECLAKRNSRL
jgi:hypothetical protein